MNSINKVKIITLIVAFAALFSTCKSTYKLDTPLTTYELIDKYNYDWIGKFIKADIAIASKGSKKFVINKSGKRLFDYPYDGIRLYTCGRHYKVSSNLRYGFIDAKGKLVVPLNYRQITYLSSGFCNATKDYQNGILSLQDYKFYPIDNLGIKSSLPSFKSWPQITRSKLLINRKDEKYSLVSLDNEVIIPHKYKLLQETYGGDFVAQLDSLYGLLDKTGATILPFQYEQIKASPKKSNQLIAKKKLYGLLDEVGSVQLDFKFENIEFGSNDYFIVEDTLGFGLLDSTYNDVLPREFNAIIDYPPYFIGVLDSTSVAYDTSLDSLQYLHYKIKLGRRNNLFYSTQDTTGSLTSDLKFKPAEKARSPESLLGMKIIRHDQKVGLLNDENKLLHNRYYDAIYANESRNVLLIKEDNKYGLYNFRGKEILPIAYDGITTKNLDYILIKQGRYFGFADFKGNIIIAPKFKRVTPQYGFYIVQSDSGVGLLDSKFNYLIPDTLASITHPTYGVRNNVLVGRYKDRKEFIYYLEHKLKSEIFDQIDRNVTDNQYLIVNQKSKFGLINLQNGSYSVPLKYHGLSQIKKSQKIYSNLLKAWGKQKKDNQEYAAGVINALGDTIIPFDYDRFALFNFKDSTIICYKNEKSGVIDFNNNSIIPFKYESIQGFRNKESVAKTSGKFGVINLNGDTIIPFTYDKLYGLGDGKRRALSDSKYGYINNDNKVVIDFKYSDAEDFQRGLAVTALDKKYGLIDKNGLPVIPHKYESLLPRYSDGIIDYSQVTFGDFRFEINFNQQCIKDCPSDSILQILDLSKID